MLNLEGLVLKEVVKGTMVEPLSVQALTILKHLFRQDNDNGNVEIVINFFHRLALSLGGQAGHHVLTMFVISKEIEIQLPSKG